MEPREYTDKFINFIIHSSDFSVVQSFMLLNRHDLVKLKAEYLVEILHHYKKREAKVYGKAS